MELRFVPSESTFAYFEALKAYLRHHGKPVAFCTSAAELAKAEKVNDSYLSRILRVTLLAPEIVEANAPYVGQIVTWAAAKLPH